MARLMLIGHPAGLCGILLSDLLIIIFRAFKLSCFRDLNLRNLRNLRIKKPYPRNLSGSESSVRDIPGPLMLLTKGLVLGSSCSGEVTIVNQ